jgi:MbtH protein
MGIAPVPDITAPDGGDDIAYIAAVNDEGQYAMWRAGRRIPHGWQRRSAALPEADCLAFIESAWRDIRPASVLLADPRPINCHGPANRRSHQIYCTPRDLLALLCWFRRQDCRGELST